MLNFGEESDSGMMNGICEPFAQIFQLPNSYFVIFSIMKVFRIF